MGRAHRREGDAKSGSPADSALQKRTQGVLCGEEKKVHRTDQIGGDPFSKKDVACTRPNFLWHDDKLFRRGEAGGQAKGRTRCRLREREESDTYYCAVPPCGGERRWVRRI